jgi:hypothetical protein
MNLVKDDVDLTNLMDIGYIVDIANVKVACLNVKHIGDPYIQII